MELLQAEVEAVRADFLSIHPYLPSDLETHTEAFDKLFPSGNAMYAITDLRAPKPVYLCSTGRAWLGVNEDFLLKWDFGVYRRFLHPDNIFIVSQGVEHFLIKPKTPFPFSIRAKHAQGEWQWLFALSVPLYSKASKGVSHSLTILEPLREVFQFRKLANGKRTLLKDKEKILLDKLSNREREILLELSKDRKTEEIAKDLHLSVNTLRTHQRNIRKKLKTRSSAGLIRFGLFLASY
jgi:DNA-binding CsgD family transcriptional regulator